MCGTEPLPTEFRARKYRLDKHFLSKVSLFEHLKGNSGPSVTHSFADKTISRDPKVNAHQISSQEEFLFIMRNLPVHVSDEEISEMFAFADKDGDGQLSYEEFEVK